MLMARHHFAEALALSQAANESGWSSAALNGIALIELRKGDFPAAAAHLEEAEAMLRASEDLFYLASNLLIQGLMMLFQRNYPRAESLFREGLALAHSIRNAIPLIHTLQGLACSTVMIGEAEKAARLFGAAEASCELRGIEPFRSEGVRLLYEHHVAALRGKLDEETCSREWALGRRLPLDEVVALALGRDNV
jgi:tetratricopeptide (TPR) repeat protein